MKKNIFIIITGSLLPCIAFSTPSDIDACCLRNKESLCCLPILCLVWFGVPLIPNPVMHLILLQKPVSMKKN